MNRSIFYPLILLAVTISILSCGGGGSTNVAGVGGTGITSNGQITGFGSVFVNGIEYFTTNNTSFSVDDDDNALESTLKLGMVVTITGTTNTDGVTGTATSILYDNTLQGPISDAPVTSADLLSKTFHVLGTTVIIESNSTVFDNSFNGFGFDTIAMDDIVEISGFYDANNILRATYINKKGLVSGGNTLVEVRGTVTAYNNSDTFTLTLPNITLEITIDLATTDTSRVTGGIADGQFVEVEGVLQPNGTSILATRIDSETQSLGLNIDKASIEGIVTDFISNSNFKINGQSVDASAASTHNGVVIADGQYIEAEGPVINGILIANEIEGRSGNVRISAYVLNTPNSSTVTVEVAPGQSLNATINSRTLMKDERDQSYPFSVVAGDFIEVEGYKDNTGIIATSLKRETPNTRIIVQGPLETYNSAASTVTVLGATFTTSTLTIFEDSNSASIAGQSAFYGTVSAGETLRIEDDITSSTGDGLVEKIKIKD